MQKNTSGIMFRKTKTTVAEIKSVGLLFSHKPRIARLEKLSLRLLRIK